MSTNDKKDKNEELFDHIIEYGASSWADDISPDDIPEEDLSDQLNQKMDNMFSSARKRANRKRRFITARRIAAVFVVLLTMASITVMSVDAFREPIVNFIFNNQSSQNRTKIQTKINTENKGFNFAYMPSGYSFSEKNVSDNNSHISYKFQNKTSNLIYINIVLDSTTENYSNIDKSDYSLLKYNNTEYYYIQDNFNQLLWYKNKVIYKINASLSKDELIKIAEGITYNQNHQNLN